MPPRRLRYPLGEPQSNQMRNLLPLAHRARQASTSRDKNQHLRYNLLLLAQQKRCYRKRYAKFSKYARYLRPALHTT
jgi:hypothetical protein